MIQILLSGANGKMGRAIAALSASREDCRITAGLDITPLSGGAFPVFTTPAAITVPVDVLIDFSHPAALPGLLQFASERKTPAVIATTGLSPAEISMVESAAAQIPVFFSANMSLGVNLLLTLSQMAARVLGRAFDIEIIERHHNQKIDAPSGTALMLADGIRAVCPEEMRYTYDRHSRRLRRQSTEIGIHSVRGGSIVGEHEVVFAGQDEVLSLTHSAASKQVFAAGALNAALFLTRQKPGLYDMGSLVAANGREE